MLRALRCSVAFVFLLVCFAPAWAGAGDDLRALEQSRRDAVKRKDFATLRRIYDPGYVAVTASGQIIDRARLFAVFEQAHDAPDLAADEIDVLVFGDSAIVVGRLTARSASGAVVGTSRFSHTFRRAKGEWRLVFGQMTPIPRR